MIAVLKLSSKKLESSIQARPGEILESTDYKFIVLAAIRGRCILLLRERDRFYLTEMREGVAQWGTGDL